MSHTEMTLNEMTESLTGYEELAVVKHFDRSIAELLQEAPTMAYRALAFTNHARSEGVKAVDAKAFAMGLSIKDATAYFRDDSDDEPVDAVTLETAAGKDEPHE